MKILREVVFYKNHLTDFLETLPIKTAKKIYWTIDLVRRLNVVPETYLKKLADADRLFEIRVEFGGDIFRVFCFFDEGNLVVLTNGFQKKSQRTPRNEIDRALRIRDEYYGEKQKH
ncbi:MAG TPA: type II toxin-antitoxin system RelE/ParE family toxin [Pyrinomonadaceae bacterium]|nr:type II toxin-antitoxin system RelE/ParE family toxin [Pyrinomonadaceae bacterium]